jgi:REP element-mobilizing transposase RayT
MNRGHNREVVFTSDGDHAYFLSLLDRYPQRFAVRLFHYCLLSNHSHFLVQGPQAEQLSPWMAGLLRAYVHYVHRQHGFVGHLWQGRFQSPALAMEAYFLACARYIVSVRSRDVWSMQSQLFQSPGIARTEFISSAALVRPRATITPCGRICP